VILANEIKTSILSPEQQAQVAAACSGLPEKLQRQIADMVTRSDFEYYAQKYLEYINKAIPAFQSFTKGDGNPVTAVFNESLNNPAYDFGQFALPFVSAVGLAAEKKQGSISPELNEALLKLQASMFRDLPDSEVVTILKKSLLYFLSKVDMVHQLKRRYVFSGAEDEDNWGKEYYIALQQNEELLGSGNISVDGKGAPPYVKNWIQDFVSFLPTPVNQRTALEEAQYFAKSSNLKVLSAEEKKLLQEILQLHDWLLHPFATYEEIELAESGEKESTSDGNRPAPKAQAVQPPVVVPRNTPKPSPAPTPRPSIPAPMQIPLQRSMPNLQDMLQDKDRRRGFGDITKNTGVINQARTPIAPTLRPAQGQRPQAPAVNPEIEKRLEQLRSRITKDS
jgi:hypothetical protein